MDGATRTIGLSLVIMGLLGAFYFFNLILDPPAYNSWVDHDRWYDLTLQIT